MENIKSFLFYSFAFSTGLFIYTIILYLGYLVFLREDSSESLTTEETVKSSETINDLNELDFLEDVDEENV